MTILVLAIMLEDCQNKYLVKNI